MRFKVSAIRGIKYPGTVYDHTEAMIEKIQFGRFKPVSWSGFLDDDRGQMGVADQAVSVIVSIVVAGLLAAFLLPIAIEEIVAVDTAAWDAGAAELWSILPIMIVLAIFLFFVTAALARTDDLR